MSREEKAGGGACVGMFLPIAWIAVLEESESRRCTPRPAP
jgi:hypothetical protein